jgi:hypothetical protein
VPPGDTVADDNARASVWEKAGTAEKHARMTPMVKWDEMRNMLFKYIVAIGSPE